MARARDYTVAPLEDLDLDSVRDIARDLATEAGGLCYEGYRGGGTVHKKGPIELVTEQDYRSERLIRDRLGRSFPTHHVVAEEGEAEDARPGPHDMVWYVDPLDGTNDFARGHPFWCVSIALYRGAEGLVGAVEAPALGLRWSAAKGRGASRNDAPCAVSSTTDIAEAMCATGFPYDKWTSDDDNLRELGTFLKHTAGIRRCGSAAIDLAMVADGTYDVYWERGLHAWDMCAGALVVREAGGAVRDYDGHEGYPRTGRLVATNGPLQEQAVALIQQARRSST